MNTAEIAFPKKETRKEPPLVATLTLNPCIDRTVSVSGILQGGTNRILASRQDISGKGINVSKALKHLQAETVCLGFNFSENAEMVEKDLDARGIAHDFVVVPGRLRTNIKIFDESSRVMTEFNERGEVSCSGAADLLMSKIEKYLECSHILVLNGSAPLGMPSDIYKSIIEKANQKGVRCVLDASGALLTEGIRAKPYLIKPNLDEFRAAFGERMKTSRDYVETARRIIRGGVRYVCLSMGGEGAMLISAQSVYLAKALDIEVKGVQGAGDSLVAGICLAMLQEAGEEEMLRCAAAAAGASLLREGTQMCTLEDFRSLLEQVKILKAEDSACW